MSIFVKESYTDIVTTDVHTLFLKCSVILQMSSVTEFI
jgi:hypothetical protein